ncbi:MAG TPA: hypothetical protein PLV45_07680 [bacterium]|nr:hypothetical protein [bacterium]
MITDQKWTPDKYKIKKRKGRARYDGVIKAGSFVFTIENKPHHEAINPIQLDPDLEEDVSINLDHPPVVLYWEELISQLTSFLTKGLFSRNEEMLVEDFLEYAQTYFWFINPFDKLSICKNDKRLVNFRCHKLMEEIVGDDAARYHRGAGYYIPIRPGAVKQVWIGVDFENKNDPRFYIDMYPGDTLNQARYFFSKLDRDRLARFLDENKKNVLIDRNLHFSFMATNLVWCDVQIDTEAYITYWNERIHTLGQISRDAKGSFRYYIDQLKHDGMISESDIEKLTDHFEDSRRQTMTPCPGMFIRFSWSLDEATSMDKEEGRLALEARKIIDELLAIWGQTFQPDMQ